MPTEISNKIAAGYGLMVMHAMDMYRANKESLSSTFPQSLIDDGWHNIGYIIGTDRLPIKNGPIQIGGDVCYGYVARRGNEFVVAIRGTDRFVEWVEDAEFLPYVYAPLIQEPNSPEGTKVEQGFWSIYKSMVLARVDGDEKQPLHAGVAALVVEGCHVTVTGHSLGAPLASYLTLELARGQLGERASGCFFASPHPGNHVFADYFDKTVTNYRVFNYILDIVPRVPFGPDYTHLPKRTVLRPSTAEASIQLDVGCNHHVICYSAMLDYEQTKPFVDNPPPDEAKSASCVLGPEVGKPTLAKMLLTGIGDVVQV